MPPWRRLRSILKLYSLLDDVLAWPVSFKLPIKLTMLWQSYSFSLSKAHTLSPLYRNFNSHCHICKQEALMARLFALSLGIFSVAWWPLLPNLYNHPHPGVVARYRQQGATLWDTGEQGAIKFRWLHSGELQVDAARDRQRRWWH